jgi:signal transduction histidine kinase
MKNTSKIIITIVIQVSLILTSFSLLGYYESQQKPFYDMVNYAGKDRFLAEKALSETISYGNGQQYATDPLNTLQDLEQNIKILKSGGIVSGEVLVPLPDNLIPLWNSVNQNFIAYKTTVEEIRNNALYNGVRITQDTFDSLQEKSSNLVSSSDGLVVGVADYSQNMSDFVIQLQAILMVINIASHIVAVLKILQLLKNESAKMQKLDKLAIIGETAARLGHDLRNPLSVIKMNLDIMKLKTKDEGQDQISKEKYDTISKAISRMSHQIDDVLDFVRIRPLYLEDNSLSEIINEAAGRITKPENVKINLPQNDIKIICDAKRLEVVFINLITNAVQAVGDKGKITVKINSDMDKSYISIEDSGPGIPSDIMPKIFDPLFTTKQTGTGLGLPSCKNIIEQHNGAISVKNNPTTFTVIIPKIRNVISPMDHKEEIRLETTMPIKKSSKIL